MKNVIITDTHFGIRNNSTTWWNSQSEFIYKQLIPYIKEQSGGIRLIHCGDLFDSRSSINTYIMALVKQMIRDLCDCVDEMWIVAGNHDFCSPDTDQYCNLDLILETSGRLHLVTDKPEEDDDGNLYIPWFVQEKYGIDNLEKRARAHYNCIYTHADIVNGNHRFEIPVVSGHIHTPMIDGNRINLGSTYAINFADSNADRSFYIMDGGRLEAITNQHSIRFYRIYNEDILTFRTDDPRDYVELYIDSGSLQTEIYQEKIKELSGRYKNLWVIPQRTRSDSSEVFEACDITSVIDGMIPDTLKPYFEKLRKS